MRSEFQFFMAEQDETEFLTYASSLIDSVIKESSSYDFFMVGDVPIQFQPSERKPGLYTAGRISIASDGWGLEYLTVERADKVYNALRRWLKKRYTNKLICRAECEDDCRMTERHFWIGPFAQERKRANPNIQFKQFEQGNVLFELEDENT